MYQSVCILSVQTLHQAVPQIIHVCNLHVDYNVVLNDHLHVHVHVINFERVSVFELKLECT